MVTVLAPIAILAIWGGSYVWSCVLVLSAPGKPVEVKYNTRAGVLHLIADSYAVDWNQGSAHVEHPRIYGPSGSLLAEAEHVDATGISFPTPRKIVVHVRNISGTLIRLSSGRFDFQDYLPERKGPPSQIPFDVNINRADLKVIDLAGKSPYQQSAAATDVDVRGVGDEWIANGNVDIEGNGGLRAEVQSLPNEGILVSGNTAGLQLASLLDHVRSTPDLDPSGEVKNFRASSLEAIGPVSVFIPKGKGFLIQTRLKAIAKDVHYRDYSADQAFFDGVVSGTSARGELDARYGLTKAKFNGSVVYGRNATLGGELTVDSPSSQGLPAWVHRLIPNQISYTAAHLDGWLEYAKPTGVRLEGPIVAQRAVVYGQDLDQPKVTLSADSNEVRVGVNGGRWAGAELRGALLIGIKNRALTGAISAASVDLNAVARRFKTNGFAGTAQVSLLVGGTTQSPTAVLQASGSGAYRLNGKLITGRFQAAGNYLADRLHIDRFRVGTDAGSARAIGIVSIKDKRLALTVDVDNVRLEKLREDIAGSINASGMLTGTLTNPLFRGHALALEFKSGGQDIPFASADVKVDRTNLFANNLQIVKGTGEANGAAALRFKTQALSGSLVAKNVLINEYLGDQFLGTVEIPKLTIGGTLKVPLLAGTAYGDNLVLGGIRVDRADIASTLKGTVANLDSLTAKLGSGSIDAVGQYDYAKKSGSFTFKGSNLSLDRITPPGKGAGNVTGILNGQGLATISPSGTWRGKADGNFQAVNLNNTDFGGGTWKLGYDGDDLTGNASIGKLDRFLLLENVDYNTRDEQIKAQVSVLNGSLEDLYTSSSPFFPDLSFDARQKLASATGDLDTTVGLAGAIRNPDIDVKFFEARNLSLQGQPLGSLKAVLNKTGTIWNIASVNWSGPQGILVLNKSTIDTKGNLNVDGDLSNLDLKYIGLVDPNWAELQGEASLSFLATGRTASPEVRASLESTKGSQLMVGQTGESFSVNLDTITVRQALYAADGSYTGGIAVSGKFFYRGFSGDVVAQVPLNFPLEIPDGPEITASLKFPNVDVKDIAKYATALDTARSTGTLQGTISVVGPKTKLALQGSILGQADTLAFNDLQTTLKATLVSVKLQDNKIVLAMNTTGSVGGKVAANLSATIPDLRDALDQIAHGDTDTLRHVPVQGTLETTDFAVKEDSKNKEYGNYHAIVNSNLAVSGPAVTPMITGRVGIKDSNILLPSVFAGAGPTADMLFDPHFEIPIQLDGVARFRTSAADVSLTGGGLLTGSLARPNFGGTLTLQSGKLNLPTARIALEEGGTLRPSYSVSSTGESNARVDVDLEGTTAVTAMKLGDTVQRYDIRLFITGDLLGEGGLNLNASSDPPDLSKDEILGLLGQTDVLKSIGSGSGATQSEAEARIRNALVSIAIPQLTQGLTSQLATNLGLQYLNLDYNPIEGASLDFAKVLGKGLILQGRRQLSPTVGNRKIDYDLRLTYRLPSRNVALSRVVFSFGLDQDRPYKLGVTYGFRF